MFINPNSKVVEGVRDIKEIEYPKSMLIKKADQGYLYFFQSQFKD